MTVVATGRSTDLDPRLLEHRTELRGYCYRMLGSAHDAEDAVQETMIRAWKGLDRFEGRSSLRSWLYRIATNVCLTMLEGRGRRALPMDLEAGPFPPVAESLGSPVAAGTWVEPAADSAVLPAVADPADLVVERESIRLAFVVALQHLPPRQRAVLILREVLRWSAEEVADLLDTTTASVNSALQRARASMARKPVPQQRTEPSREEHKELLARYVEAFERYDIEALVKLLHEDATQDMPPYRLWIRGRADIATWMLGPGAACRDSRVLPVQVNGTVGFVQWKRAKDGDGYDAWALHVLEVVGDKVASVTSFLETDLFAQFGVPLHLDADQEIEVAAG
ncbi:sigma-70 family RNA polymerase sigma factor [Vallicoccus soli]|uniref:Sigma-70 family RNA polymerase sigma factor n=1 Tax=Vallicoccus soli TaxID=2339232 RepID=A0A3A3YVL5_9ACTN|nr:sigma-70 family RNA polymerase sigma factor [Vallicoccus soli]RJK94809.1 sigma-70 family RNA polymerase sigma factor [Vallicoccus soli]